MSMPSNCRIGGNMMMGVGDTDAGGELDEEEDGM
jgi:hypothetical protein